MVACAILCDENTYVPTQPLSSYNWNNIVGGMGGFARGGKGHRAPHLDKSGTIPTGGNQAMMDGSGKWVKVRGTDYNMIKRNTMPIHSFIW